MNIDLNTTYFCSGDYTARIINNFGDTMIQMDDHPNESDQIVIITEKSRYPLDKEAQDEYYWE